MRGIALGLVGIVLSVFATGLYVTTALKAASSGEEMFSVPLFALGVVLATTGAVLADLDWREERARRDAAGAPAGGERAVAAEDANGTE